MEKSVVAEHVVKKFHCSEKVQSPIGERCCSELPYIIKLYVIMILEPLLFIIYVNNCLTSLILYIRIQYADDIILSCC